MQDEVIIEKGTYEYHYPNGTVRVTAPRDILLKDWEEPLQRFLRSVALREAEKELADDECS